MYSVVIPLYNKESYIARCVSSLGISADLAGIPVEFIIVNDCSTDSSLEIVESILDERIKVIDLKFNKGPSNARNVGALNASYENIFFIDADDVVDNFIFSVLKKCTSSSSNFICIDICRFDSEEPESGYIAPPQHVEEIKLPVYSYHKLLSEGKELFTASSVIIRKSVFFDLGGFSLESNFTEDAEFWARLSYSYEGVYVPLTLSYYRMVESSLSHEFFNNFDEIPILLKTLVFQYESSDSEYLTNALETMIFKYLILSKMSGAGVFDEINDISKGLDTSFKIKFLSNILPFIPSVFIRFLVRFIRSVKNV